MPHSAKSAAYIGCVPSSPRHLPSVFMLMLVEERAAGLVAAVRGSDDDAAHGEPELATLT